MTVAELERALFERFPRCDAEPWDHVGLSVGRPDDEVVRACCALDATESAVRATAEHGANLLLTHHPVHLKAPDAFTPADPTRPACGAAVFAAVELGVSIISLHTNLDRSLEARELLPSLVGLKALSSLEHVHDPALHGLGAVCTVPECSLGGFAAQVAHAFDTEPRVWGDPEKPLLHVAFLGGSLGEFGEQAIAWGADAIVAGEVGYHVAQDLMLRGCAPILLGHDRSEQPFTRILRDALRDAGVPAGDIDILDCPRQWWTAR